MKECINPAYSLFYYNKMKPLGVCYYEGRSIFINDKAHKNHPMELLDTLVHEETHATFPEFDEREVVSLVSQLLPTLTHPQIVRYFELYYGEGKT